ncbi:Acetyltransferase (GNAT) domain-containing protein [Virgibacillus subterraneus]|uniref:Lipid II:glycine glycyltransferase n=1 Tax=Virgibacillus subterraneus TaxID=621109 RepID=A0A1H9AGY4_9BACI|nr:GNAT family N-acetyltransferase [Virgibacillus subterraneus]SEP76052.1 Acetyltransferase (GNAT) domain-containing protein [Virgibacillus subterraneus]
MLSVIGIDSSEKWDEIVKNFENYDVYYLSDYIRAFEIHGDGKPILFYYEEEDIRAINVVMLRDISEVPGFNGKIPLNTYYDITTPYGYGGFIVDGHPTESTLVKLELEYRDYCKKNNILSEFVRFHPVLNNVNGMKYVYDNVINLGQTITMRLESRNQIWNDLKGKNRNVIRKAQKAGVEIYWGRNPDLFEKFIEMYKATMDKDDAENYYYFNEGFYKSILNDLKYNSLMFYAVLEEKIIAMSMILFSNQKMHYHLSASNREYLSYAPTNLLLYEAACWGSENGFEFFHLGGGLGGKEDSLFRFKKAFNRNSNTNFAIGKKIFDKEKYGELLNIRMKEAVFDSDANFFPAYRYKN